MELNRRQAIALWEGGDLDMPLSQARQLAKAGEPVQRRRRTTPNIFTTFEGRAQPRQGFLSTEVMRAVYMRSEVVRACVDTLIELVCGVDWAVKPKDEEKSKWMRERKPEAYRDQQKRIKWAEAFFRKPNVYETLDKFHRRLLRDLLIFDAASYEKVIAEVNGRRLPLELGVIAGDTIEIETDDHGLPTQYWQSYNTRFNVEFQRDELEYLMLNPCSWSPYGISPIETAYVSIASDLNANSYNAKYFEKNGIPPALLAVMGLNSNEFRNLMTQMRNASNDNPWNIHAFRANRNPDGSAQQAFELTPLSQITNREMQFAELLTHVVRRITMIYRISPSQIGFTDEVTGGIGSGVAETQVDLMESKGVAPLLRSLEEHHTIGVLEDVCQWDDLEFAFTQSNTPKEQQEYQRDASELSTGAMTVNEFRGKWGGRDAVDWGDLPLVAPQGWQPPMSPQQMQMQLMQAQMGMGGDPSQQGGPPGAPEQPQIPPPQPAGPMAEQPGLNKSAEKRIVVRW